MLFLHSIMKKSQGLSKKIQEGSQLASGGAFVRGANFKDVIGINNDTRIYLCRWGAINVPGGCAGMQVEDMSIVPKDRPGVYDWCY